MMSYSLVKRALDVAVSVCAIVVALPLFIALAVLIKLDSEGPVFFVQRRVGLRKRCFNMLKFRTMRINSPKNVPTHLLDDPTKYITSLGTYLRKSSLDELPQLFCIVTGAMSLVGPRPALWNQHDLIAERDKYGANEIRPGLTGWAQINGRDELPVSVKARLDGEYVRRMSLTFDMRCILLTFVRVLKADGIAEGRPGQLGHRAQG